MCYCYVRALLKRTCSTTKRRVLSWQNKYLSLSVTQVARSVYATVPRGPHKHHDATWQNASILSLTYVVDLCGSGHVATQEPHVPIYLSGTVPDDVHLEVSAISTRDNNRCNGHHITLKDVWRSVGIEDLYIACRAYNVAVHAITAIHYLNDDCTLKLQIAPTS